MNTIDGKKFKELLQGGAKALEINKAIIDELNVFPVPDGDTGTNMSLTLSTAAREITTIGTDELSAVAAAFSRGALKGARGNSGVILSQILKGFSVVLADKKALSPALFAQALKRGTEIAYGAVTKPKEGTILTVVRVMAESAQVIAKNKNIELQEFLSKVIDAGESILLKTPEMLPVLAKAGVVDAGGRGLVTIFDGMLRTLRGQELVMINGDAVKTAPDAVAEGKSFESLDNDYENITFQYCTEFFITHLNKQTTEASIDKFRDYLMTIGDCVLVIGDLELVKTHVHTNNPDKALRHALMLGELDGIKIENMMEQHRKIVGEKKEKEEDLKEYALVSVCAGDGMANIFKDLMIDVVVEGGQTMNPSVNDILAAINSCKAKNVFVLPNNGNIIMAASQAKELAACNVYVVPTTCVPEGISAALVFSGDLPAEENFANMKNAASSVLSAEITHAVRSTRMNGFSVKEGDIIGIHNKKIVAKSHSVEEATLATAQKISQHAEMITLYYGEGVDKSDADRMIDKISAQNPDIEIAAYYGGQPHYYYIISAE